MAELKNLKVLGDVVIDGTLTATEPANITVKEAEVATTANIASRLASPIVLNGLAVEESGVEVASYTVCETSGDTASKTAELEGFVLTFGAETTVKFTNANSAVGATLNINNTGAIPMYYEGAPVPVNYIAANSVIVFRYNGTQFDVVGELTEARVVALQELLEDHTHNYAGSSTPGGAATSADKLNTDAGDVGTPVFFQNGIPVPVTSLNIPTTGNASTATTAKTLDGMTATVEELNFVDGVTSNIQTQLDNKDALGAADSALAAAKEYTDAELAALIDSAPEARNTLGELAEAMAAHEDAYDALLEVVGGKAAADHTHNYAGSSSVGGAANSANKLNTDAGDTGTPVYFKDGIPVPVTSLSIPTTGNADTATKAEEAATATTLTGLTATVTELNYMDGVTSPVQDQLDGKALEDHTHAEATEEAAGLMSAADKAKLNGFSLATDADIEALFA